MKKIMRPLKNIRPLKIFVIFKGRIIFKFLFYCKRLIVLCVFRLWAKKGFGRSPKLNQEPRIIKAPICHPSMVEMLLHETKLWERPTLCLSITGKCEAWTSHNAQRKLYTRRGASQNTLSMTSSRTDAGHSKRNVVHKGLLHPLGRKHLGTT